MTFGNSNSPMTFGDACNNNTIANKISGTLSNKVINFGSSMIMTNIKDYAFGVLAANLDLSAATHIKGTYNTEIYYDKTDGAKLSYIDAGSIVRAGVTD